MVTPGRPPPGLPQPSLKRAEESSREPPSSHSAEAPGSCSDEPTGPAGSHLRRSRSSHGPRHPRPRVTSLPKQRPDRARGPRPRQAATRSPDPGGGPLRVGDRQTARAPAQTSAGTRMFHPRMKQCQPTNEFRSQPHEPPTSHEPQHESLHRATPNQDTDIEHMPPAQMPRIPSPPQRSSTPEKPMKTHPHSPGFTHSPTPSTPAASYPPPHSVRQRQRVPRTGWVYRKVKNPESVSDHMYRMAMMSLTITDPTVDRDRCIKLALVHDMAECIVGDIAPSDNISKAEKHRREEEATKHVTSLLPEGLKQEIYALWEA
ncbi:hypothetical protein CHARACLAT_011618 [Characodon lateralis]|uniref:HD domain-containing protein n=1 Tax=Characodon lateralis TaxID=208331 RepID=A0ABU7DG97_9TELE|nr:hypothetical protein [Characodon lateralis]